MNVRKLLQKISTMGWELIKCPKTDTNISWPECLRCDDKQKYPDCPLLAVREFAREREYQPNVYHVTELPHPRRSYFGRTIGYAKGWDEDSYITFLIGTATHRAVQSGFPRREIEIRVGRDFGEFKVTGSVDIISKGVLYELKTSAGLGALIERGHAQLDHVWQAQAYYSLLRATQPHLAETIKIIKIIYFGKSGRGAKQYKEFKIKPEDISDDILARARILHEALNSGTPPTEKCPSWLCGYCEYTGPCEGIKHGFKKNDSTFKRYLIQHKRGVERVAEILRTAGRTVEINPLAVSDVRIPDPAQKQRPEWDIEDLTAGKKIDVKTTTRRDLWCNAAQLERAAELDLIYYFVLIERDEIRRIEAKKLYQMRTSVRRETNRFGEKGYVFPRDAAEVIK